MKSFARCCSFIFLTVRDKNDQGRGDSARSFSTAMQTFVKQRRNQCDCM